MIEAAPVTVLQPVALRPAVSSSPRRRRVSLRVVAAVSALALIVLAVVAAWAVGIRIFVVESPSMGSAAPVGSLVVGQAGARAAVGDLITFQPPGDGSTPYTHRIVARVAGGFSTRGDINGAADPWTIAPSAVISRATAVLPGVGWLIKAGPLLLGALVVAQIIGLFLRSPATRWSVRTAAVAVAVAAVSWTMKPFSGFVLLSSTAADDGMRATVVSTALLPIRVSAARGGHVDLLSGQVGQLLMPRGAGGHVTMAARLDLDPLGWIVVAVVCLLPVIAVLVVGVPIEERADAPT